MARITELWIRDVRCFAGDQCARLGRITLLVGENSTGKSTLLGCCHTLAKLANLDDLGDENHFEDAPFRMGSFGSIARSGSVGFSIGGRFDGHSHTGARFSFGADGDVPVETAVRLDFTSAEGAPGFVHLERLSEPKRALRCAGPGFRIVIGPGDISYRSITGWLSRAVRYGMLPYGGDPATYRKRGAAHGSPAAQAAFARFVSFFRKDLPLPAEKSFQVVAPEPRPLPRERSYASLPEHLRKGRNAALMDYLAAVGVRLKLWHGVRVVTGATGEEAVEVAMPDGWRNLVDVGYGVHTMLPIASVMWGRAPGTTFLLQQPEAHVHPMAQALLAQMMAESEHRFVIETHSDHFLDRFRVCTREGAIPPEDVSIVYCEPNADRTEVRIHSLKLDARGNVDDAPANYRDFYLAETHRLLGFRDQD